MESKDTLAATAPAGAVVPGYEFIASWRRVWKRRS